jgi:plastocyanin
LWEDRHVKTTSVALLLVLVACGEDGSDPVDASARDATDGNEPDAPSDADTDADTRSASIVDCARISGVGGVTAEVTDGMGYVPSISVTIRVGQGARFAYADGGTEHTIVSGQPGAADGLFGSPPFSEHGHFTCIRFDAPGMYPIHCDRHPDGLERGTITVVP